MVVMDCRFILRFAASVTNNSLISALAFVLHSAGLAQEVVRLTARLEMARDLPDRDGRYYR